MENSCTIEVQVLSHERPVQEVADDVKSAVECICGVDGIEITDVNGRGFKVQLPSFLDYQVGSVAKDLEEMVEGIGVIVQRAVKEVDNGLMESSDGASPRASEEIGKGVDADALLERGVMVDGWGRDGKEDSEEGD